VVSTPIVDVVNPYGIGGLVEIAANASEMSAAINRLQGQDHNAWLSRVDRKLRSSSWGKTWAEMETLIDRELQTLRRLRKGHVTETAISV
jgi:hypothetical protein